MKKLALAFLLFATQSAFGADAAALQKRFQDTVQPFVGKYCAGCHSGPLPAGQFDIKSFTSLDLVKADFPHWSLIAERLTAREMPPRPIPAPPPDLVRQIVAFVADVRAEEIRKSGDDPGLVLARRLSNAEYDNTIRDLTGQDMQVARQFPVDPANMSGFDNSGESLTMSPALLNKYLQAARQIADHMVLRPDAIDFAPYIIQVETDREKYAIQRILSFYARQPTDYAQYFQAAWRYRYRTALGRPRATLASAAADANISPRYLPRVWDILHDSHAVGPVARLQAMWNALPAPQGNGADQAPALQDQTAQMRDFVTRIRAHTAMQFAAPVVKGLRGQSQPLLMWKLREFAANRRNSDPADLRADSDPPPVLPEIPDYPRLHEEAAPRWAALSAHARAGDADLVYPAGQRQAYQAAFARFASVFPDTFYVTERGRYFPDESEDKGRLLSAGFHSVLGFFRDDTPLSELILDARGRRQLDRLWDEFDYVADITARTWTQYFFNQSGEIAGGGAESGMARIPGHEITDTPVIWKLRDAYLARAAADPANDPVAPRAIRDHFERINTTLRKLETERKAAEPKHLAALTRFAERAYRRPLTAQERASLLAYYRSLRAGSHLSHEDAIRESLVSILMAPDFLYRVDLSGTQAHVQAPAKILARQPLSGMGLANRLSYFLWSSMPDAELLRHAAQGDLNKPAILLAQTARMLKDPRVRGLATEFTGNWLAFRQFETNNSVDRARFPDFTDELREAMFQEPIRLMEDNITHDRSVLDLLYGDYTFVNPVLARHYGMPAVAGGADNWVRVDNAARYGRGGILPMAVFMTQNSPGLRTSPVKRGNWVVQKVLGIRVPPPPPVVPELPGDEAKTDLPIRQMLEQHHTNPVCAGCHLRFDSFGLAFEGYGPVGDVRTRDLAGRPIDASASFPGGFQGNGLAGLQEFIRDHRQDKFVENLSRKLLSYALNRSPQLSDEALVDGMKAALASHGYRFSALVQTLVLSPQFLNRAVAADSADNRTPPRPTGGALIKAGFRKAN